MSVVLDDRSLGLDEATHARLEQIWEQGNAQRQARILSRRALPVSRLWNGDWNLISHVVGEIEGSAQWKMNDRECLMVCV
ncbi:hypothetical protein ACWIB8_05120 [Corynebacterium flavescens]